MRIKIDGLNRKEPRYSDGVECEIEKVITLPDNEFLHFKNNLLSDYDFIKDNRFHMCITNENGKETAHCIAVKGETSKDAVIVESEGSRYARYSAYLPDASAVLVSDETKKLIENLSKFNESQVKEMSKFIGDIVSIKEDMLSTLTLEEPYSCISLDDYQTDFTFNTTMTELLQKLIEADERVKTTEFNLNIGVAVMYPEYTKHDYENINVDETKYEGEAEMNCFFNSSLYAKNSDGSQIKNSVVIEKTIELEETDYEFFSENFHQKTDFIMENQSQQYVDYDDTVHCLFVKPKTEEYGVLICNNENGDFCAGCIDDLEGFEEMQSLSKNIEPTMF